MTVDPRQTKVPLEKMVRTDTEDAALWRRFPETVAEAREGFADISADAAQALIDEAVTAVRNAFSQSMPPDDHEEQYRAQ